MAEVRSTDQPVVMETTVTPATFALCAARPVESPSPTVLRRRRLSRVLLVAAVVWLLALIALASRLSESAPLFAAALVPPLALLTGGLTLRSLAREVVAPPGPVRALEVSSERLQLTSGGREVVSVPLDCPFGVTLFSSPDRRRLLAAVSAGPSTLLFGTRLSGPFGTRLSGAPHGAGAQAADARLASQLLPACVLFSGEEGALDATAPDGEPTMLGVASFVELVAALEAVSPGCVGRLLLTDQRGDEIRLESDVLFARRARFELHKPLEWRATLFQESFGQIITICQGTWIRQGQHEVTFVSLLSPQGFDTLAPVLRTGDGALDHLAIRDQRLLQAGAGAAPPTEQRVALDGLFVLPLRVALDDAPRASSQTGRARHA